MCHARTGPRNKCAALLRSEIYRHARAATRTELERSMGGLARRLCRERSTAERRRAASMSRGSRPWRCPGRQRPRQLRAGVSALARATAYSRDCNEAHPGTHPADTVSAKGYNTMHIIWILLIGLVVGALAKFIMPGRDPGGAIITILLGIAGSFIANY